MEDLLVLAKSALEPFKEVANLTDLYAAYKTIPFNYVLAGHCLFAATMAPDFKHQFLVHFWMTFIAGFGGGVLSSLLMMDPIRAPINIFANNAVGVTYFVCWWLINYCPFNLVGRIHSLPPVKLITKLCVNFLRANLIINRVDLAVSMFPGVIAAPLILGTLAGSGGKLLTDGVRTGWGAPPAAAEASAPTFIWRSAALAAAGYWAACKYTTLLTSQEAGAVVITVLLAHSILSDILGPSVTDFTYPIAKVAHTVSLVPMPGAAPAPSSAKAAKKAAAQTQPKQQPKQQQQQQAAKLSAAPAASASSSAKPVGAEAKAASEPASSKQTGVKNGGAVTSVKADSSSKGAQQNGKKSESKKGR